MIGQVLFPLAGRPWAFVYNTAVVHLAGSRDTCRIGRFTEPRVAAIILAPAVFQGPAAPMLRALPLVLLIVLRQAPRRRPGGRGRGGNAGNHSLTLDDYCTVIVPRILRARCGVQK